MKFNATNTIQGLVPCNDDDYDIKKKLKLGEVYEISVRQVRNYEFLKKYFALINCSWDYLTEAQTEFFRTKEIFRKTMEINAGHAEPIYIISERRWSEQAKSVAFDKMSEADFSELYERVKDSIFTTALRSIRIEEFMKALSFF